MTAVDAWVPVCRYTALLPERGAAALLPGGAQVALFRTHDGEVHALGNVDPFSQAAVISRGIVGDRAGEPVVTSPMHKQPFALRTGECLDNAAVSLPRYAVKVDAGTVYVELP
ncbi:nitrite reductase small subunit NirD [Crossiella sp. CA-258035]|uniref:nitrite reductase small subunit NirD n=1 Tax=Crossiella sp. CA-258035 TaxID=2981138 RepID=UPI0024BCD016|nr:nitrite reductase small subunit NirD [Crossiella sp. CA-258035]WHT18505.1 nitrite reductase small subunit NirD [Crossiella sp. CA-258035]